MEIQTRVCGIPAVARVKHYFKQRALGPSADSDLDCYGYEEIEFEICDRNGRAAPWLERKMTRRDAERIEAEISQHVCDLKE